uniref:PBPe domain-containing protein n=1 Tax=Panagrellus redivivus TaxID=6233 RepID=A0A7E4V7H8_PANRE
MAFLQRSALRNLNLTSLLNGHLRVLLPNVNPPFVNYHNLSLESQSKEGYSPGILIEILNQIGEKLNLTYEYVNDTSIYDSLKPNDTFDKVFASQDIDIIADATVLRYTQNIYSSLTYPIGFEFTGMMIRSPDKYRDNTWLIVTEPFSWEMWLLIVFSVLLSAVWLKIGINLISRIYNEQQYSPFNSFWIFFSIFVQQGLPRQPKSWALRVFITTWWLASITLMAGFTGSLVALFTVEREFIPIKTLQEFTNTLHAGHYTILVSQAAKWQLQIISESVSPELQKLWNEINVFGRVQYVDNILTGMEYVKKHQNYVLFGPYATLSVYADIECNVAMLPFAINPVYLSIPMRSNSPYLPYFSYIIRDFVEFGLVDKWFNDFKAYIVSNRDYRCNGTTGLPSRQGFLTLSQTQGAFWILIFGLSVAALYLGLEHSLHCFSSIKRYFFKVQRHRTAQIQMVEFPSTIEERPASVQTHRLSE